MADNLAAKCLALQLRDDENDLVDLGGTEDSETKEKLALILVGKVLTKRPYNVEAFKRTMTKVWAPANNMLIRVIGSNLYAFQFFHWKDKDKVLKGRPWCWENHLLVLKEVLGDEQPEQVLLNHSPFWVRVCKLPFNCRSNEDIIAITSNLGEFMEREDDQLGLDQYRHVRIMIDIRNPIRRYQWMKDKSENKVKVEFKYERLPYFFFACGVMGHSKKDCDVVSEEEKQRKLGCGIFLRACPRRGFAKEAEEVALITAIRKQLFVTKENEPLLEDADPNLRVLEEENE